MLLCLGATLYHALLLLLVELVIFASKTDYAGNIFTEIKLLEKFQRSLRNMNRKRKGFVVYIKTNVNAFEKVSGGNPPFFTPKLLPK